MKSKLCEDDQLDSLRRKHAELSERVDRLQGGVRANDPEVTSLKKEKLQLKEQIRRLGGLNPDGTVNRKPRKILAHHF